MKLFSRSTKLGMGIMLAAGVIMAVLVVIGRPVPEPLAWIFLAGNSITFVSSLVAKSMDGSI